MSKHGASSRKTPDWLRAWYAFLAFVAFVALIGTLLK